MKELTMNPLPAFEDQTFDFCCNQTAEPDLEEHLNFQRDFIRCCMDRKVNDIGILLSMETCWEPLYEAYRVVADTYGVSFVMQSIEPGFEIYENTDDTGRFFCDRYSIRYENESFTTPSGQPISQIIECEEFFTSSESVLERFESAGYHAATLTELKEKLEGTGITIYEFKNSYK